MNPSSQYAKEIQTALDKFADEHSGLERAQAIVDLYRQHLVVSIIIIDSNGKIDETPSLVAMKDEMAEPLEEMKKLMENFTTKEPASISLAGNYIGLSYWDWNLKGTPMKKTLQWHKQNLNTSKDRLVGLIEKRNKLMEAVYALEKANSLYEHQINQAELKGITSFDHNTFAMFNK
jgi:hypothetical protein